MVRKIKQSADVIGLEFGTLVEWGRAIKKRFESDNASQMADLTLMPEIAEILCSQSNDVRNLSKMVKIYQQEMTLARETHKKKRRRWKPRW